MYSHSSIHTDLRTNGNGFNLIISHLAQMCQCMSEELRERQGDMTGEKVRQNNITNTA